MRYYDTPKEETYDYVGSGMLVGLVNRNLSTGSVEIHAKKSTFIWKNQEDYIQGNVWLDGEKIFGDEEMGFTTLFVKVEPSYSCITTTDGDTSGNMFLISKDLKNVLCGVRIEEEEFLLVVPAEDKANCRWHDRQCSKTITGVFLVAVGSIQGYHKGYCEMR